MNHTRYGMFPTVEGPSLIWKFTRTLSPDLNAVRAIVLAAIFSSVSHVTRPSAVCGIPIAYSMPAVTPPRLPPKSP